jgi:hypothetical protein
LWESSERRELAERREDSERRGEAEGWRDPSWTTDSEGESVTSPRAMAQVTERESP